MLVTGLPFLTLWSQRKVPGESSSQSLSLRAPEGFISLSLRIGHAGESLPEMRARAPRCPLTGHIETDLDTRPINSAPTRGEVWYISVMKLLRSIVVLMVPFLVAGCYEISMDFNVNDDGSGNYEMGLEVDLEAVTALLAEEDEDIDPISICDDMLSDAGGDELAGDDAEVKIENDGSVCRQVMTGSWEAGDAEIVDDSGEDLALTQVGDGWRFELNLESLTSDLDDDEEMDPAMLALMGVEITYALTVTLPGSITEHNGELSGNTVSWEVNLLNPPAEETLYVQSSAGGSSNSTLVIVIIIALVLLAGVSVFLLRRKTNSSTTFDAETSEVGAAEIADSEGELSTE